MLIGRKERILHRIPLTVQMVLVTIVVGTVVWFASDYFATKIFRTTLENHLIKLMGIEAVEQRSAFDNYVKAYSHASKLFAHYDRFIDYVERAGWSAEGPEVKYYRKLPTWLPKSSILRLVVQVRYALLLDGSGRVREVYMGVPDPLPETLLHPSVFLMRLSHDQSFMTQIGAMPFLVASESVSDDKGKVLGTLMLVSPIDDEFLISSQGIPKEGRYVALLSGNQSRIISSSAPDVLPHGTRIDKLGGRFYITGKGFFDYGASDLGIGFAALVSKEEVAALTQAIIPRDREQNAVISAMFILAFAIIMFIITRRIVRLTAWVNEFSIHALGGNPRERERGDEMEILENRFQCLTEEVVATNHALTRARDELEARVEDRTQELSKLLTTLNTLVEHMPEGVALLDTENRIVLANPIGRKHLLTLCGAETGDVIEDIMGRPLNDLLVSPPHLMWHDIEAPGPPKSIFQAAARFIGQATAPGGIVLVLKDVTEESELQARVHQQERLASVGKLAAGIAHDFNNILSVIIGYSEMLAETSLSEETRKPVELILESGQKATNLIRQMLDFSRLSASEPEIIDMRTFVLDFSEFIRRTIPEDIEITVNYGSGEYVVKVDPTKMQQVLANLAVNARDAMPEGGKLSFMLSRLSLKSGDKPPLPEMHPGEWITLSVADTGTGVPAAVLPRIFEPFYSTKGVGKGTGLGLSQVYGIVTQHDGFIDVSSGIEVGTTFTIYLPAVNASKEAPPEAAPEAPKGHGETILLVEDDESVRDLSRSILGALGYKLITASNGTDALEIFRKHKDEIALVITDIVMPEMGGQELSRAIKRIDSSMEIIALSGYPLGDKMEELRAAGIEQCLPKPVQKQTLAIAVKRALNNKS